MDFGIPQLPSKFLVQLVLIHICWFPFQCRNHDNELYLPVFYFLTLFYSSLTHFSHHYAQQKWFLFRQRKIYGCDSWFQYFQFPNISNIYHKFWISFQENPGTCAFSHWIPPHFWPAVHRRWLGYKKRNVSTISSEIFGISLQKAGRQMGFYTSVRAKLEIN